MGASASSPGSARSGSTAKAVRSARIPTAMRPADPSPAASVRVRMLTRAGLPADEHLLWISILDNFVLGSALDAAAPDQVWTAAGPDTPALAAAVAASLTGRRRADAAFLLGTEALMTGMRARLGP